MERRLPFNKELKKVDIPTERRYVTPAVRLERKNISMLNPPPGKQQQQQQQHEEQERRQQQQQQQQQQQPQQQQYQIPAPGSDIASTGDANTGTTIVGEKGPLEEEKRVSSPLLRAPSHNGQSPKHPAEEAQKAPPPQPPPPATTSTTMKRVAPPSPPPSSHSQEQSVTTSKEQLLQFYQEQQGRKEEETVKKIETQGTEQETRTIQELRRTQVTQKEATQVYRQEQTQRTQELSSRTSTSITTTTTTASMERTAGARTTSITEYEATSMKQDDGTPVSRRSPATKPQSPARQVIMPSVSQSAKLETAEVIEFFEERAPSTRVSGVQIAEQSVRQEATNNVMEFFEEQPFRQESVRVVAQQTATRQETLNVIEFFEEQDGRGMSTMDEVVSQQPTLLVVPSPHQSGSSHHSARVPRSSSPSSSSSLHASVGLNHLDNLIRLMEQLSNLKDENVKLRKKCDYLETTKNLLKARSDLMSTSDSSAASGHHSLPSTSSISKHHRHRHHHHHSHHHHHDPLDDEDRMREPRRSRPRLSSVEDVPCLEISESASDHRPKRPKGALHKRSFSTGSLEVEILDETGPPDGRSVMMPKSKSGKNIFSGKSPKQKSKSSKWARVKKVLTGQFWYEDLGTTLKSLKEFGRSTQRYSSVSTEGHHHHEFHTSSSAQHLTSGMGMPRSLDTSIDSDLVASPRLPGRASSLSSPEASSAVCRSPKPRARKRPSGGVEEPGTEIWMGPPDWWEQYESRKRQSEAGGGMGNGNSSNSDVSSVIEVKTMYLGSKQKDTERLLRVKPLTRRQSSPSLISPKDDGEDGEEYDDEDYDEEDSRQIRRSASYKDSEAMELPLKDFPSVSASGGGKPSSESKKLHRKAWGRVKEIIHVRRDSDKKKQGRRSGAEKDRGGGGGTGGGEEWSQGEETSEIDVEGLLEEQMAASGEFGEGIVGRSTPKTSPMVMPRKSASKSFSESPPAQGTHDPSSPFYKLAASSGSTDVAALLASSMSEEFVQKMHAWQELQLRKSSSFKFTSTEAEGEGSSVDGAGVETQELLSSQTSEADRTKSKGTSPSQQSLAVETQPGGGAAATAEAAGGTTTTAAGISPSATSELSPLEVLGPTVNVEELHHRISESFSRKLAEWERRKYRRPTTPEMEHKGLSLVGGSLGSRSRKEKDGDRSRSKKSREDKERERQEKLREREMQKVEKEQVKLEKEKVRIEKERLRAMERQAKLERMKGRLSQTDTDAPSSPAPASGSPPPPSSPGSAQPDSTAQVKVTADFKKKLEEWEQMKGSLTIPEGGMSSDAGTPSPQPTSASPTFTLGPTPEQVPVQGQGQSQSQDGEQKDSRPPPLTLQPYFPDSPEEASPVDKVSDVSYGDDSTSVTEESITKANISSLERANSQLLKEVQRKEQEYASLQEEVSKLNAKLDKVRQEHAAEMARFKRELEAGTLSGPVQLEVGELESTVRELEEKILLMEDAGDQLAESMESAAIGKWQSIEGEEMVSQELIDMVEQMKGMLVQAARSSESPQDPLAPSLPSPPPSLQQLQQQPLPSLPSLRLAAAEDPNQKSSALHNFETVYSHAMKLQVQMNNLRVSQLERNKEIMLIKRQLLLQEVNNVLLQAHITRRETELYQYREAKKHGTNVRRWNTFSGQGDTEARPPLLRNVSLHESDLPQQPLSVSQPPSAITAAKHSAKHDDIPCATDENASIPKAGIKATTAAAAGKGGKGGTAAGGGGVGKLPPTKSCPVITTTAPTPEKPSDRKDQHFISPAAAATSTPAATTTLNGRVVREQQQQQAPPSATQARPVKQQQQGLEQEAKTLSTRTSTAATAPASTSIPTAAVKKQQQQQQAPAASSVPRTTPTVPPSSTSTSITTTTSAAAGTVATTGASKVETGSPTLLARIPATATTTTSSTSGLAQVPSAGQEARTTKTETPAQPIPEGPDSAVAAVAGLAKEGEEVTAETPSSSPARPPDAPQPAPRVDDKYSQPESVMECAISAVDTETGAGPQRATEGGAAPSSPVLPAAGPADGVDITKGQLQQPQEQQQQQQQPPKAVRSPVSRQKYLRRQKEEREKKKERTASPKTPHKGGGISGKPPPHPQSTPHQSPSSQRSKSVGDMEGIEPDSAQADAPLRDVIQKFEKRATVCETEERKIEFRKTPSPTLHLPRVGLVSRIRRLKPAAELLEESQRYRSGHSIYATRIMNRYLPAKSPQSGAATPGQQQQQDKENVSSKGHVQAMVKRLSREGTPVKSGGSSSASSCLSLPTATDPASPVKEQELVSHLIHKLSHHQSSSSGSGPAAAAQPTTTVATTAPPPLLSSPSSPPTSSTTPLKDVTNGGRTVAKPTLLAQAFGAGGGAAEGEAQGPIIPAATLSDQQQHQQDRTKASEGSLLPLGATAASCGLSSQAKPDSTISPTSHTSMPALAYDQSGEPDGGGGDGEDGARERAATYCVSEGDRLRQQQEQQLHARDTEAIEHIAEEFLDPALLGIRQSKGQKISPSSSTKSKNTLCCQSSACAKSKSSSSSSSSFSHPLPPKLPSSPKSQERRGGAAKEKKETIGVLCKQSMSFDLGVSLRSQSPEAAHQRPQSAEAPARLAPESGAEGVSGEGDKLRPSSTSSEGEAAAASGDDKKKPSRSRFLDSSWLQKPKKFFKVSK